MSCNVIPKPDKKCFTNFTYIVGGYTKSGTLLQPKHWLFQQINIQNCTEQKTNKPVEVQEVFFLQPSKVFSQVCLGSSLKKTTKKRKNKLVML